MLTSNTVAKGAAELIICVFLFYHNVINFTFTSDFIVNIFIFSFSYYIYFAPLAHLFYSRLLFYPLPYFTLLFIYFNILSLSFFFLVDTPIYFIVLVLIFPASPRGGATCRQLSLVYL